MVKIEFHYDFGSPNAYVVHKAIPSITDKTGTFGSPTLFVGDEIYSCKVKAARCHRSGASINLI